MSWDIAIVATISLDAAGKKAWSKQRFDAARYDDWPPDVQSPGAPPATFEEIVADLRDRLGEGAPLGVRSAKNKVELAVVLPKHEFQYRGPRLATAFRDAAGLGAKGRVDFVGFVTSDVFRSYLVEPGGSTLRDTDPSEREEVLASPQLRWLEAASDGEADAMPAFRWPATKRKAKAKAKAKAKQPGAAARPASPGLAAASAPFDAVISGELRFGKKSQVLGWARAQVAPRALPGIETRGSSASPHQLTATFQDTDPWLGRFVVDVPEKRAMVEGVLPRKDVPTWAPVMAGVFEAAGAHGGSGTLRILSPPGAQSAGFVLDVGAGGGLREASTADHQAAAAIPLHAGALRRFGENLEP